LNQVPYIDPDQQIGLPLLPLGHRPLDDPPDMGLVLAGEGHHPIDLRPVENRDRLNLIEDDNPPFLQRNLAYITVQGERRREIDDPQDRRVHPGERGDRHVLDYFPDIEEIDRKLLHFEGELEHPDLLFLW
jgi:hypothetical protein